MEGYKNYQHYQHETNIPSKRFINVIDIETRQVIKRINVTGKSETQIESIDAGLNINLNHNKYITVVED